MKLKRFLYCLLAVSLSFTALTSNPKEVEAVAQDFTTYNEYDLGGDLTVSSSNITFHLERIDNARVYKDFGAGYFSEDFQTNFEWEVTTSVSGSEYGLMLISNTVGTEREAIFNPKFAGVSLHMNNPAAPDEVRVILKEVDSGLNVYDSASYLVMPEGTNYYFSLLRDDDAGTHGKLTLNRYNDAERQNLSGSIFIDLHEQQNFRYLHAITGYNNTGAYTTTGFIKNLDVDSDVGLVPDVLTYEEFDNASPAGALLMGWGTDDFGTITSAGFDIGIVSANYTAEYLATGSIENAFSALVPAANITIGTTYYFRAKAENAYGWGYGSEKTFSYSGDVYIVYAGDATVVQTISGNFTAAFIVTLSQPFSENVSARLSANYPDFSNPIPLYNLYSGDGQYLFDTWNGTYGSQAMLSSNITYYYQGIAEYESVLYYSEVKSFTTTTLVVPDRPLVTIIKLRDISAEYDQNYVYEVTGKITTSNTTDWVINQGVQFSQDVSPSGALLPTYYQYFAPILAPDNTFVLTLSLDNADWYSGQTLYFRVFAETPYYGRIFSSVISYTPPEGGGGGTGGTGVGGDDEVPDVIESFDDMITRIRTSMHLYGVMGTWAFMGLAILLVSLVFGIAMIAVPAGIAQVAIGVAWLLASVAVVGAFIFTGQLGIWPLIILVGGVVVLVLIVLSVKLSGGTQNG